MVTSGLCPATSWSGLQNTNGENRHRRRAGDGMHSVGRSGARLVGDQEFGVLCGGISGCGMHTEAGITSDDAGEVCPCERTRAERWIVDHQ